MADFIDAEQQVVVAVLHGHETELGPGDFENESHRLIVHYAKALRNEGILPDAVQIKHRMKERGELHLVGNDYLEHLFNYKPSRKIEDYEALVQDSAIRRRVIQHANGLLGEAESGVSTSDLLVMAQTQPLKFDRGRYDKHTSLAQDEAFNVIESIESRRSRGTRITGVETPWRDLNAITCGLQYGDLIIIAGRPSMGKTAMAGQIASHAAAKVGPVFVGSLEMSKSRLVERMLVGDARVDATKVRDGSLSDHELDRIKLSAEKFQDYYPMIINDSAMMTAQDLRMAMSKAHLKYNGLSLAVIDYLGLIREGEEGKRQRYREVAMTTQLMRATAKELGIPVVLLCQLNRGCELRPNKRPTLADLRESGDIEQDSDLIIMLYRDEYYCDACSTPTEVCGANHEGVAEVLIRKQREGPIGVIELTWEAKYTQFLNLARGMTSEVRDFSEPVVVRQEVVDERQREKERDGNRTIPF